MQAAFDAVDTCSDGVLSVESLRRYLKINGYQATNTELDAIMRRLDGNCDFLLSFTEFIDALRVREPETLLGIDGGLLRNEQ